MNLRKPERRFTLWILAAATTTAAACTGTIDSSIAELPGTDQPGEPAIPPPGGGAGGGHAEGPPPTPIIPVDPARPPSIMCNAGAVELGRTPLRRLSHLEYDNTLRDLLQDTSAPATAFPRDPRANGYDTNADLVVSTDVLAEQYFAAAEAAAGRALGKLATLLPCTPSPATEDACALEFIRQFGQRAYRRPLSQAEINVLQPIYAGGKSRLDFAHGIRLVIETMLASPQFLYRVELGAGAPAGGARKLTDFEVATRLSYLLWSTMPDPALFSAAAAGQLSTTAGALAQASRMLADPKAKAGIARFAEGWMPIADLHAVGKDAAATDWTDQVKALLRKEILAMVDGAVAADGGKFATLMTSTETYWDGTLAAFYGVPAAARGATFTRVGLDGTRYAGLLGRAGVMASLAKPNQSSPVGRGFFVRSNLLCQTPPPPPPGVNAAFPEPKPGQSTRERLDAHRTDPACGGCHQLMDPLGYGLENFDATGRWRTTDGGKPVDAAGEVTGEGDFATDINGPYTGPVELAGKLAGSRNASACFATQVFRFAAGRAESTDDVCTLSTMIARGHEHDYTLRSILLALVESQGFLYRHE